MTFGRVFLMAVPVLAVGLILVLQRTPGCPITVYSSSNETVLLRLINDYRAENELRPVVLEDKLQAAAMWLASDMAVNDYASHTDSLGRYTPQRLRSFGYTGPWFAEVIVVLGTSTERDALRGWQESPAHDSALLGSLFETAGVGLAEKDGEVYNTFWVVVFGVLSPTPVPSPSPVLPTVTPESTPTSTPDPCSP